MRYSEQVKIFKLILESKTFIESNLKIRFFNIKDESPTMKMERMSVSVEVEIPKNISWFFGGIEYKIWNVISEYGNLASIEFDFYKAIHFEKIYLNGKLIKKRDFYLNKESRLKIIEILEKQKGISTKLGELTLFIHLKLENFKIDVDDNVYLNAFFKIPKIDISLNATGKKVTLKSIEDYESDLSNWLIDSSDEFEKSRFKLEDELAGDVLNQEFLLNYETDSFLNFYLNITEIYGKKTSWMYNHDTESMINFFRSKVI